MRFLAFRALRRSVPGAFRRDAVRHAPSPIRVAGEHEGAEEVQLPIENKYAAIAAVVGFFLMLWLTDGSLIAAFGVLALIAGIGWAVRRLRH
jgi:hypothetical protein